MLYLVFDIETKNTFYDVGERIPELLDISVVSTYDSGDDVYTSFFEKDFEKLFRQISKADALVGYNSDHFDIPLLNKYYPDDLNAIPSIDLMKTIYDALGRRIKLDNVVKATLAIAKSGHGLDAIKWWQNGELDKLAKYCEQDVKVTKELFEHMREHGKIKYTDKEGVLQELIVNTSPWNNIKPKIGGTSSLF